MKSKATLSALTLAAILAAGVSTAIKAQGTGAEPRGAGAVPAFSALDANGDGTITADEVKAWQATRIAGLDANSDGFLTADEIANFRIKKDEARIKARAEAMVTRLDTNGDGKISAAEMMTAPRGDMAMRMFGRVDTNHDGKVGQKEYDAAKAWFARMRFHFEGRKDGHGWGVMGHDRDGRGQGAMHHYRGDRGPTACQGMGPGMGQGQGWAPLSSKPLDN